jgi:hypothetical protein
MSFQGGEILVRMGCEGRAEALIAEQRFGWIVRLRDAVAEATQNVAGGH